MNYKFSLIPILALLALALAACGEGEPAVSTPVSTPTALPPTATVTAAPTAAPTETPIPPTPEPTTTPDPADFMELFLPQCDRRPPEIERPTQIHPETGELWYEYRNDEYGFAFLYPPDWELLEGPYYICLNYRPRREVKFIIGFKWAGDTTQSIVRSGVAAGQLVTTGTVNVLGQEVERNLLVYEDKNKAILYDNAYHIRADGHDLLLTMSIDDFRPDYDAAELTPDLMATADAIAESFSLIYVNDAYGFAFTLPPDWRILPDGFSNILRLSYRPDRLNGTILTIGFKWEEEDIPIMRTGTGELDQLIEGEIEFMGRTIRRDVWRYEGKTTAVFYANAYHINVDGLLFTLSLDYWDPRQIGQLSAEAMESADAIVQSFRLTWEAEWRTVQVDDLGFTIDIPADWHSRQHEWDIYFGSDRRFGEGEGPTAWVYSVYALEYPNPDQLPWPEALMPDLSEGIRENFAYTTDTIGDYTVYITEWMPSAYGALTVFYERDGRYLSLALTPYDRENPYPAQARHLALFEAVLESFTTTLTYDSEALGFQFAIPPGYRLYESEHPEAALLLSLYEESAIASEQIHKPEIFVAIHLNPNEFNAQEWLAAHTADAVSDIYPIYVNPHNPQITSIAGRAALTFEDMTWSHAFVTLVEGDGYILVAGYTPYADDSLAEAFTELLASLHFDE